MINGSPEMSSGTASMVCLFVMEN